MVEGVFMGWLRCVEYRVVRRVVVIRREGGGE